MNIYVGNLPYKFSSDQLRELFAEFGEVRSANVIIDRATNQSKGFGFVEMADKGQAETAIKSLNDRPIEGRNLRVNEARPRENGGGGGFGGGPGAGRPPRRDRF